MKKTINLGPRRHSMVRAAVPFYEDILGLSYVKKLGIKNFGPNSRGSRRQFCEIATSDCISGRYFVSLYSDGFVQRFDVTIDQRFCLFFERFLSLYYSR